MRSTTAIDSVATAITSSSSSAGNSSSSYRRRPRTRNDDSPAMRMEDGTLPSSSSSSPYGTSEDSTPSSSSQRIAQQTRTLVMVAEEGSPALELDSTLEGHRNAQRRLFHGSSSFSSASSIPQQHQHQSQQQSHWLMLAWSIHFISSILVLIYGTQANDRESKYIPIDVSKVLDGQDCDKAFVDVFSSSLQDPGAFVCCRNLETNDNYNNNPRICIPPPLYLPFARRLAKFPDAWILPVFPLIVRLGIQWYNRSFGPDSKELSSTHASGRLDNVYSKRRFYLYLALIQIRGWILYAALDELEDLFVVSSEGEACWYEWYLHANYQRCQGRMMDFSDHIVLYFAQIIPIALVEILHALFPPGGGGRKYQSYYWCPSIGRLRPPTTIYSSYTPCFLRLVPVILSVWLGNLYVVTFLGAFKTAAYFHTASEVWVGFVISLVVQIPLFLLQSTEVFRKQRDYFFGSSDSF